MKEFGDGLILFQFFHKYDLQRIMEDGPWSFDQSLILMNQLQDNQKPEDVVLSRASFWVQVHGLSPGFLLETVARGVGDFIGIFEMADPRNFEGVRKEFMRVRVSVDVTKPLKSRMKLKREGGGSGSMQRLSMSGCRRFALSVVDWVILIGFVFLGLKLRRRVVFMHMGRGFELAVGVLGRRPVIGGWSVIRRSNVWRWQRCLRALLRLHGILG